MKKIGIYAEDLTEFIDFIRFDIKDTTTIGPEIFDKYVYLNPLYPKEQSLEKLRGFQLSTIFFASKRLEEIYDFFNYTKSKIR